MKKYMIHLIQIFTNKLHSIIENTATYKISFATSAGFVVLSHLPAIEAWKYAYAVLAVISITIGLLVAMWKNRDTLDEIYKSLIPGHITTITPTHKIIRIFVILGLMFLAAFMVKAVM